MGNATITGELGEGKYTVSVDYGTDVLNAKLANLTSKLSSLEAERVTLAVAKSAATSDVNTAKTTLNTSINALNAAIGAGGSGNDERAAVNSAVDNVLTKQIRADIAESQYNRVVADIASIGSYIEYYSDIDVTDSLTAWCTDYTLGATGSVATMEIPGEPVLTIISPECAAPVAGDGEVVARPAQASTQVYLNAALLPGWQKFSPTYRVGVLTAIDRGADTGTVALDTATSSAQELNINQAAILYDVPIDYMTCNSAAFTVGDDVVVKFEGQSWSNPKVIGFKDNPKACGPNRLFFYLELYDDALSGGPELFYTVFGYDEINNDVPSPGNTIDTSIYRAWQSGDTPGGIGTAPVDPEYTRSRLRVRYDTAWEEWVDGDSFDEVTAYSVDFYGPGHVLENQNGANWDCFYTGSGGIFKNQWNLTAVPDHSPSYCYGPYHVEFYNFGFDYPDPCPGDRAHQTAWMATNFDSPPTSITVDVGDGALVDYVLESVGARPDLLVNQDRTILPLGGVPPSDLVVSMNKIIGVIYRRDEPV